MGDFLAQFQSLKLRKEMLNAANIYLFEIIHTKCKYVYRQVFRKPRKVHYLATQARYFSLETFTIFNIKKALKRYF